MFVCCECCVLSLRRIDHSSRGVLPTVARRCVWSRNLENEEAKARYRAVKIQPQWVVTRRKTNNCTCKFEKHKQSFLSENYEQTSPNKKHTQSNAHEKHKQSFPSENYNRTFHNKQCSSTFIVAHPSVFNYSIIILLCDVVVVCRYGNNYTGTQKRCRCLAKLIKTTSATTLGIPTVRFRLFQRALPRCPANFGLGRQMARAFPVHKNKTS
jgi:hypothetical protein